MFAKEQNSGEDCNSNHCLVMQAFEEAGYCVRFQKLCPTAIGIPMGRHRIHYQGVLRSALPNPDCSMNTLKATWDAILAGTYTEHPLSTFLTGPFPPLNLYEVAAREKDRCVLSESEGNVDRKWKALHKDIFEQHEAGWCFSVHSSLLSFL